MGTFAKIFIVVNLVLAVVVLGAGAALLGTAESWKQKYEKDDVSALTADAENRDWAPDENRPHNMNVVNALRDKADEVEGLKKKIEELKSQLLGKTTEVDKLASRVTTAETEWKLITQKYNQASEDFGEMQESFKALNKQFQDARNQITSLQGEVETATAETAAAKQAREEVESDLNREKMKTKNLEEALASAEKSNTDLVAEKDTIANELALYRDTFGNLTGAKVMESVRGVVTGIDEELNIVLISVGEDDKVAVGYTFKVFRGGDFVGMLVIDRVGPDWASGHMKMDESKSFPQRGDDVATRL